MFLTGKQLGEVFLKAKKQRFGIIASNVVFDTQIRALVQGYAAVNSDGLMQMSSGACKYAAGESQDIKVGAALISTMIKTFASQFPKSGVGLHIDHATPNYFDFIVHCIEQNLVTSVMIDASKEDLEENIRITKEVVDIAHKHGVLVEGEIGHIKGAEDEIVSDIELYTRPEEALEFVQKTNVDLFAASVGTNHGVSKGENIVLRLDLIKEIDDLLIQHGVERGLVLHGASGLTDEQQRVAIANGVVKINKDTHYQMDMAEAIQAYWEKEKYAIVCPPDVSPEDYIPNKGKFDPRKWLIKGEEKMKNTVMEFCRVTGSADNSILL
ncbi:MAG TPA: class II fructose-bisphosphate aldolase [Candidatus Syntrophosphaera sp.]|jgi:ketose-bisphosphate aldolase|nr:class II fructose-bisphosphate aldolase [Candidatus Cloacimonadota bacterium]HOR03761.1 class II fructose-bisphosphate aldolase [Candidatus Syntrophosphaera sp.]MDI9525251.1 class II fructose-bisphosphate aldolase [Candidatus Cloacimonadota bacterium]NLH93579.1 class II fructose-bisphosphate aldolase [Candidatus Cloacimonadota bacterium]HOU72875.1 class II fructose-bisphosphate aldolase [Candidatus Syntrophosphaera sp.]